MNESINDRTNDGKLWAIGQLNVTCVARALYNTDLEA